jgi:hypothetical protein
MEDVWIFIEGIAVAAVRVARRVRRGMRRRLNILRLSREDTLIQARYCQQTEAKRWAGIMRETASARELGWTRAIYVSGQHAWSKNEGR